MHFSGENTTVKEVVNGVTRPLEVVEISFSSDQGASPIYAYGMKEYVTAMNSSTVVQGVFAINLTEVKYEWRPVRDIIITHDRKELLREDKDNDQYEEQSGNTQITLKNVNIISHSVKIHPSSENLIEVCHFLAETFE